MFKHNHILVALLCAVASLLTTGRVTAQQVALPVDDVSTRFTADTLHLSFAISQPATLPSNYAVWVMPCIGSERGDTLTLSKAVFRGKRNMHYVMRERHFSQPSASRQMRRLSSAPRSTRQPAKNEVLLGDTVRYDVAIARKERPWIWQDSVTLSLKREREGCCSVEPMPMAQLSGMKYVEPFAPRVATVPDNTGKAGELQRSNPVLHPMSEYKPYTRDRILRKERGALYVHFALDKADLRRNFRDNAQTLDRIVDITRQIMNDSTSSVRCIQIVGLASVEGSAKHNEQLAAQRGAVLKRYIQQHLPVADSLFEVANGGEAWTELRSQIADSDSPYRDRLTSIIDSEVNPAERERKLKALDGGKAYAWVREHLLGDQRNSGYMRIYYDYVPDTAAATINSATDLIANGEYAQALQLLQGVRSDRRAQNALGVALYMTGSKTEAMECFRRAANDGNKEAQDNLRQLER